MGKKLPARPNLDHLRRQAKALLAALESGDSEAIATIREHLPSAKGLTAEKVRRTQFRLADAQSAIARKTGFASWPQLARHVETLRSLEGTWEFTSLEIEGNTMPPAALTASRLLIDGDRFRTESPEATYEGVFNINVEADPHEIDIEFVAGPEAGNWNYGIFRLDGDRVEFCLDLNGKPRPKEFKARPGSGHAYETLKRSSHSRPANVTGGTAPSRHEAPAIQECVGFEFVDSPTLSRLQGEWTCTQLVINGKKMPAMMLKSGIRVAKQNEIKISFGGQVIIQALVRIDESKDPMQVDYYNLHGAAKGQVQYGIMKWIADEACFCMAEPGKPRPGDFECTAGSGRTLSQWKKR
jgi:uncharacterized protein (TIGR03067 family)